MSVRPRATSDGTGTGLRCSVCDQAWPAHLVAAAVRTDSDAFSIDVRVSDCVTVLMAEVAKHKTGPAAEGSLGRAHMDLAVTRGDLANAQRQLATAQATIANLTEALRKQADDLDRLRSTMRSIEDEPSARQLFTWHRSGVNNDGPILWIRGVAEAGLVVNPVDCYVRQDHVDTPLTTVLGQLRDARADLDASRQQVADRDDTLDTINRLIHGEDIHDDCANYTG